MQIKAKRIRNPRRYLYELSAGDAFYIVTTISDEDQKALRLYGMVEGETRIPISRKACTEANANGKWIPLKHLPKEDRIIEHEYHIVDWHGDDHYGTCYQTRQCYQRKFIPPTELAFTLEKGVVYSPMFRDTGENDDLIKATINILLEMFGRCEIWSKEKTPVVPPVKQRCVPWEILKPGTRLQNDWETYISEIIMQRPEKQRTVIKQRHEFLWDQKPDFCVVGSQNFWGYVVYGFQKEDLYIFECNKLDNATYVFRGNWEAASQLTKTEILSGHVQETRLFHTEHWKENLRKAISKYCKEGL